MQERCRGNDQADILLGFFKLSNFAALQDSN